MKIYFWKVLLSTLYFIAVSIARRGFLGSFGPYSDIQQFFAKNWGRLHTVFSLFLQCIYIREYEELFLEGFTEYFVFYCRFHWLGRQFRPIFRHSTSFYKKLRLLTYCFLFMNKMHMHWGMSGIILVLFHRLVFVLLLFLLRFSHKFTIFILYFDGL
jgi:hypothetical protein